MQHIKRVPCTIVRGGASKGVMFERSDLPENRDEMFAMILKIMGAPDSFRTQVQGLGGGKSTSNKVGVVSKSNKADIDVDYLFCQVNPDMDEVDIGPNCGNFISAVPIFAIYKNLVNPKDGITEVKIYNENTAQVIHATVHTTSSGLVHAGDTKIDGVMGTFPPIELRFFNVVGSKTRKLFPTGNKIDIIDGVKVSCLDVAVPMVIISGSDLGIDENTDPEFLRSEDFLAKLRVIRYAAATLMGFGDVTRSVIPKVTIICSAKKEDIRSYYFDPFTLHDSHAVTGAMCLASACVLDGTIASEFYKKEVTDGPNKVVIEHHSGTITALVDFDKLTQTVKSASFIRTGTILMDGIAFVY